MRESTMYSLARGIGIAAMTGLVYTCAAEYAQTGNTDRLAAGIFPASFLVGLLVSFYIPGRKRQPNDNTTSPNP